MPIFRSGRGEAPSWCEMEYFDMVRLGEGKTHRYVRASEKERIFIGSGDCILSATDIRRNIPAGEYADIEQGIRTYSLTARQSSAIARVCGRWGDEIGGCGVFTLENSDNPSNKGDPVLYPKQTDFDCHYHDFDEYWIIIDGRGLVMTERKLYTVGPGDCVATKRGDHHDFPSVYEKILGVYFETTLRGKKRLGHLWEHTHGPAGV